VEEKGNQEKKRGVIVYCMGVGIPTIAYRYTYRQTETVKKLMLKGLSVGSSSWGGEKESVFENGKGKRQEKGKWVLRGDKNAFADKQCSMLEGKKGAKSRLGANGNKKKGPSETKMGKGETPVENWGTGSFMKRTGAPVRTEKGGVGALLEGTGWRSNPREKGVIGFDFKVGRKSGEILTSHLFRN